jgi:REP element-mobilizing transposase RayT
MHVDGDYKNPPPSGVYEELHAYVKKHMRKSSVTIPSSLRPIVGQACLEQFPKEDAEVAVLSVSGQHVHVAVLCLQSGLKQMIGRVKKVSSHRIRNQLPGKVWAAGCKPVLVRDDEHWANVLKYIRNHKNAWVWCAK